MATKKKVTKKAATKRKAAPKKAAGKKKVVKPKAAPKKAASKKKVTKPKAAPKKAAGKKKVTKPKATPKKAAGKKKVVKPKATPKKAASKKKVTKPKAAPRKATGKKKVVKRAAAPKKAAGKKKVAKRNVAAKKASAAFESVNPVVSELKIGDKAPDFMTQVNDNEKLSLRDFRGEKVVLYFYPKDDTPGCTLEAQDFTANINKFLMNNAVVLGVSKDNLESHCKFKEKYNLGHTLLADIDETIGNLYGVNNRSTFLIDEDGVITHIWRNVKVPGHVDAVLAAIEEKVEANVDEPVQEELLVD